MRRHARGVPGAEGIGGDTAAVEHDLPLAELLHQVRIVRSDDHRDADFLETLEDAHHFDG